MFYFDRYDNRVLFGDIRRETFALKDKSSAGGFRHLSVDPDQIMDFTALPFDSGSFHLIVFDPPHLVRNGKSGWLAKNTASLAQTGVRILRPDFQNASAF